MIKNINFEGETLKALQYQALDNDLPFKQFIEKQLAAMGEKGISYLELWNEAEALKTKLKQLTENEQTT